MNQPKQDWADNYTNKGGGMKNILLRWVIGAASLYITAVLAHLIGVGIELNGILAAFIAIVLLSIVNALIKPLVVILTLPITCLTLGLFTVVINVLMFWLAGSISDGFVVRGFGAALFGSIVMSVLSMIGNHLLNAD